MTDWLVSYPTFPDIPVWDREKDPPLAQDIILADGKYWVVYMIICGVNRLVCYRDGVRRTFELNQVEACLRK